MLIAKDCRPVGELLFFNDIYMTALVKKIKYTLKIFLKCMNLLANLNATKRPCLVCIYIYMKYCSIAIKSWLCGIGVSSFVFCFQDFQHFFT